MSNTRSQGPPRLSRARTLALGVGLALAAAGSSSAALAAEPAQADTSRFYAGAGVTRVTFDDRYDGVGVDDASTGFAAYFGWRLRERLSLETSYDRSDAIDRADVAGSGVRRFALVSERSTVAVSAVRELSLQEIFEWRRDWRVFGIVGVYRSDVDRTVTFRGSSASLSDSDRINGMLLGAGFVRQIANFAVRGQVRKFGVLDGSEATETGVTVQRRF